MLVAVWSLARFYALDRSPGGFYYDESSHATHLFCLGTTGADANGVPHPFFSLQYEPQAETAAGLVPPLYLYPGALWVRVFGPSIAAVRAISAFGMTVAIAGLFFLARVFAGTEAGLFTVLAATLSPLLYQVSRFSNVLPIEFAALAWGSFFALRSRARGNALAAGVLLSAAMYTYPPARVQVALLLVPLLWLRGRLLSLKWREHVPLVAALVAVSLPLVFQSFSAENMKRVGYVGIFSEGFLAKHQHEGPTLLIVLRAFVENFWAHFEPSYLFFTGDGNPRASTQHFGELSWLDMAVLLSAAGVLAWRVARKKKVLLGTPRERARLQAIIVFLAVAFLAGVVPAAATWEKIPHALRSAGAFLFLPPLVGILLSRLPSPRASAYGPLLLPALTLLAATYSLAFLDVHFKLFPEESLGMWTPAQRMMAENAAATGDWSPFAQVARGLPRVSNRYYLIAYGGESCLSSERRLTELIDGKPAAGAADPTSRRSGKKVR